MSNFSVDSITFKDDGGDGDVEDDHEDHVGGGGGGGDSGEPALGLDTDEGH